MKIQKIKRNKSIYLHFKNQLIIYYRTKGAKSKKEDPANANNGIDNMIKYEVLSEDLLKRLKAYRAEYREYDKNIETYNANIKVHILFKIVLK